MDQQVNKPADALIEAITSYCEKVEGYTPNPKELEKIAVKIIKERIND